MSKKIYNCRFCKAPIPNDELKDVTIGYIVLPLCELCRSLTIIEFINKSSSRPADFFDNPTISDNPTIIKSIIFVGNLILSEIKELKKQHRIGKKREKTKKARNLL